MTCRNLTVHQQSLLIGQEYELKKKRERGGGDRKSIHAVRCEGENQKPQNEAFDSHRIATEIAKEHGVSRQTIERSAKLLDSHKAIKVVRCDGENQIGKSYHIDSTANHNLSSIELKLRSRPLYT